MSARMPPSGFFPEAEASIFSPPSLSRNNKNLFDYSLIFPVLNNQLLFFFRIIKYSNELSVPLKEPVWYNETMRISSKKLSSGHRKKALRIFLSRIQTVKKQSDLNKLLDLFFTKNEKEIVLRRLVIADMLAEKVKYRNIQKDLNVSRQTISNVRDILEARGYGRNPQRKRAYSHRKKRERPLLGYYKGAPSVL